MRSILVCAALAAVSSAALADAIVDFDELTYASGDYSTAAAFASQGVSFNYVWGGFSWAGWGYSRVNDTTTAGYGNQYAAFTGTGVGGSGNYALGYEDLYLPFAPEITLPVPTTVNGAYFTNTTYTALDMTGGSGFSKKFGGLTGNDPDWFKLTITGKDTADVTTGTVDFYLADFRFADNQQDYIVDSWTQVDLTALGSAVKTIEFAMTSSDTGAFGMNTPSYFAMDSLSVAAVPEPGTFAVLGAASLITLRRRRSA